MGVAAAIAEWDFQQVRRMNTPLPFAQAASPDSQVQRTRLVVYTALVGPKESLNNPLDALPAGATTDLDLDFVCITDNPALQSPVWRFMLLPTGHLPPEKLSRRPKALPHDYFPDATYSLYIDNTVSFKRLPQSADLITARPYLFRAFRHARHTQLDQEAFAVAALGYEDPSVICQQMDFYASRGPLDAITPLTTATVLLRSHHHPTVRQFGTVWWENVLAFAKRDQLSFDFALRQAGAEVDYFPGITRDNPFILWQGSLSPDRLRASFDARRYAWLHRDDPAAVADPKAHALAHGRGGEPQYQRTLGLLELLSYQQGCSLGRHVAPRRCMAEVLEPLLAPARRPQGRFVVVRIQDSALPQAFSADDMERAGRALAAYMGAGMVGTVLDLPVGDLARTTRVFTAPPGEQFDVVLVLGLPGALLLQAAQKLVRLAVPAAGRLVLALSSPARLGDAVETEAVLASMTGQPVRAALHSARHDDLPAPLPNTVACFSWAHDEPAATPHSAAH